MLLSKSLRLSKDNAYDHGYHHFLHFFLRIQIPAGLRLIAGAHNFIFLKKLLFFIFPFFQLSNNFLPKNCSAMLLLPLLLVTTTASLGTNSPFSCFISLFSDLVYLRIFHVTFYISPEETRRRARIEVNFILMMGNYLLFFIFFSIFPLLPIVIIIIISTAIAIETAAFSQGFQFYIFFHKKMLHDHSGE